jgi:hypothetical protein
MDHDPVQKHKILHVHYLYNINNSTDFIKKKFIYIPKNHIR